MRRRCCFDQVALCSRKIEVGPPRKLVSPGDNQQIAAVSKIAGHLPLSAYFHYQSTLMGIDGNRTGDLTTIESVTAT
jgi:hypothetical protein